MVVNGSGSITDGASTCSSGSCSKSYPAGTGITLTANPNPGNTFTGWGGDCAPFGTNISCSGTMDVNHNVSANFSPASSPPPTTNLLTMVVNGSGSVTDGTDTCPSNTTCSKSYPSGTGITLTANPNSGRTFIGWGGDCAPLGSNSTCSGTMDVNHNISASFQ